MTEKKERYSFDPACLTLAEHFLPSTISDGLKWELAQAIQDVVEDFCKAEAGSIDEANGYVLESPRPAGANQMSTINAEILSCHDCGKHVLSLDDTRINRYKCSGRWQVFGTVKLSADEVRDAIETLEHARALLEQRT